MRSNRKYRNSLRLSTMVKWVLFLAFLGAVATSFVQVQNRHITKGIEIRRIEDRIAALDSEIEMYELKLAGMMDRRDLSMRMARTGVELQSIHRDTRVVVTPSAAPEEEEAMLAVR